MEHPTVTVDVLGTPYSIICHKRNEDEHLKSNEYCDGYCDSTAHEIVLRDIETEDAGDPQSVKRLDEAYRRNLRHELIHAALDESGLDSQCAWAGNEEMVDWFALQFDKLLRIFVQADALDLTSAFSTNAIVSALFSHDITLDQIDRIANDAVKGVN